MRAKARVGKFDDIKPRGVFRLRAPDGLERGA
jgi:hypothetical protein